MANDTIGSIPNHEWDAIILTIIRPFLYLCKRDALITIEDLQQEAWIGLLRACDRYDATKAKFSTFAYSYIRGYVLSYITKMLRNKPQQINEDVTDDRSCDEDRSIEQKDCMKVIFHLIKDQKYASLLYEHFVDGKSFRQIAKKSNVSQVTIANRVNKILDVLEKRLSNGNS